MQWIQDPRAVLTELFTSLCNIAFIPFKKNSVLPFTTLILICFSNRTGTSVDDGKSRVKDETRLPVLNLPLCHWSSQLFDLRAPSSTEVPVLLLNQPTVSVTRWSWVW